MSRNKIIAIVCILALALFGFYKVWQSSQFRVVSTTPSTSRAVATSTSVIKIDFSHDLSEDAQYDRTLLAEGQSIVREVERRGQSIYVRLFELKEGDTYRIVFRDILSASGKVIKSYELGFRATYIPHNRISQAQKDLEAGETDRFEPDDPILDHIPYSSIGYSIEPVHDTTEEGVYTVSVNAKIFLSNADRGFEEQAIEMYRNQIFDYLKSKNINPDNYQFNYIIQDPAY